MPHFFEHPIQNSPYEYPCRHWELDEHRQPTDRLIESRREASFITPVPKPRKRRRDQSELELADAAAINTANQQYQLAHVINGVRRQVDAWCQLRESEWRVTAETARLLKHWRQHEFSDIRPFFCQVEAAETAIWLTEVAPSLTIRDRLRVLNPYELDSYYASPRASVDGHAAGCPMPPTGATGGMAD